MADYRGLTVSDIKCRSPRVAWRRHQLQGGQEPPRQDRRSRGGQPGTRRCCSRARRHWPWAAGDEVTRRAHLPRCDPAFQDRRRSRRGPERQTTRRRTVSPGWRTLPSRDVLLGPAGRWHGRAARRVWRRSWLRRCATLATHSRNWPTRRPSRPDRLYPPPTTHHRPKENEPVAASITQDQLLEAIDGMTVLELSEFIKKFEERYGVTAAAPAAAAALPPLRRRARRGSRGADRVQRRADRDRPEQDPGHQGRARADRPRPQGGQGPRRRERPRRSRKASPRTRPTRSRPLSRSRAPRSRSSSSPSGR